MEKRSRRRIRDLVAHPASQGLDANENRCARISMMARSANAPLKGRIQKRKTNNLQIITSGLQRTAGPYRCATINVGESALNLSARALQLQNDRPALIEADKMETILAEVDADPADGGE